MTRENIEQLNVVEPYCFETDSEERWYRIGCIDGLEAADEESNTSVLWHDASDEPKRTPILCQNERGNVWVQYHLRDYINAWREFKEFEDVVRWAYISDLLPKGGNSWK